VTGSPAEARRPLSGRTELLGVVGTPVRHSLSPILHNAGLRAVGLDWIYLAFEVSPSDLAVALAGARALGVRGLSITTPHKTTAAGLAETLSPVAARLGVVNTILFVPPTPASPARDSRVLRPAGDEAGYVGRAWREANKAEPDRPGDRERAPRESASDITADQRPLDASSGPRLSQLPGSYGESTDGRGVVGALEAELGGAVAGRDVAVLGAGGAARAAVLELVRSGARSVAVVARSARRADEVVALGGGGACRGTPACVAGAEIVINATPLGMAGTPLGGQLAVDPDLLHPGQLVLDLVYTPLRTPLLAAAEQRGARAIDGTAVLLYQAVAQFELFTGVVAPRGVMAAALYEATGVTDRLAVSDRGSQL